MKSKTIVLTSALFALCFAGVLLPSCKNDVYTMLEDYNSHYEPATNMDIIINPGDSPLNVLSEFGVLRLMTEKLIICSVNLCFRLALCQIMQTELMKVQVSLGLV